jgi:hypothetical protein
MTDNVEGTPWRQESLKTLTRLREQIAAGDHNSVRPAVYSGRWAETIDGADGPEKDQLAAAIQKTDDAHAALTRWPPDMVGAERALDEAIQALG